MRNFTINDDDPSVLPERTSLNDWAQAAEMLHSEDGRPRQVTALEDDPYGMFKKGEVVYTSLGPSPDDDESEMERDLGSLVDDQDVVADWKRNH